MTLPSKKLGKGRVKTAKVAGEIYCPDMFDVFIGSGFPTIAVLFLPDLGRDFHQSAPANGLLLHRYLQRLFSKPRGQRNQKWDAERIQFSETLSPQLSCPDTKPSTRN